MGQSPVIFSGKEVCFYGVIPTSGFPITDSPKHLGSIPLAPDVCVFQRHIVWGKATATEVANNYGKSMTTKITPEKLESMRSALSQVRRASLHATRTGDFMRVARLTTQAAQINKSILDAESQRIANL